MTYLYNKFLKQFFTLCLQLIKHCLNRKNKLVLPCQNVCPNVRTWKCQFSCPVFPRRLNISMSTENTTASRASSQQKNASPERFFTILLILYPPEISFIQQLPQLLTGSTIPIVSGISPITQFTFIFFRMFFIFYSQSNQHIYCMIS